jgi:hypothetical protein
MAMTKKSKQEFLGNVLKEVNRIRKVIYSKASELQQLPKGEPGSYETCPLANAFYNKFEVDEKSLFANHNIATMRKIAKIWKTEFDEESNAVKIPKLLSQFVSRFDNDVFPELVSDEFTENV